jgi:hypothetical protein
MAGYLIYLGLRTAGDGDGFGKSTRSVYDAQR